MSVRELTWEGCLNVRDLGGLRAEAGAVIRPGALVRSASPDDLSAAGWEGVRAHGIRTVVDLRCPTEHDGAQRAGLDVVSAPLFQHDDEAFAAAARATPTWADFYALVVETRAEHVAAAVAAVADAQPGGVLVHCMAGKDRTGIVCALSLSLAGVPDEAIGADFVASGDASRPVFENPDDANLEPELILGTLLLLRERHGSVAECLLDAGLEPAQIERLRERLLA